VKEKSVVGLSHFSTISKASRMLQKLVQAAFRVIAWAPGRHCVVLYNTFM
jgi:hypothetical protein